ncbi:ribose/xylose/arabinose/galactoside ABC-type transport system permease subunit [Rhodococcus erythropolis]|nr:ribose/xylose/arabinose/galactoside ABC-type transport system permease subunit [Rhodococcus erythropolis]
MSSIITLVAVTVVYVSEGSNDRLAIACLVGLGVGVIVGFINGLLIELLHLSAMVVTLATAQVGLGIATILYSRGVNRQPAPSTLHDLTSGQLSGFSFVLIAAVVVVAVIGFLMAGSVLGRRLTAASVSREAARYQGIRVRLLRSASYMAAALLYGACGIALVGIFGTPTVALGAQYQLSAIAAVVLGGMALTGGKLRPAATLAGAIFLAVSNQAVATTGQPVGAQNIAQGVILIAAVLIVTVSPLRSWRDRRNAKKGKPDAQQHDSSSPAHGRRTAAATISTP